VEVFVRGLEEALTYLDFPSGHQRHIKSTNVLERLFRSEDWALRRYMDMDPLRAMEEEPTKIAT
jgi:transposase-like protein